ncbi:MAG: hypothetical protein U0136_21635 [Bdellovibrionota bacterium]
MKLHRYAAAESPAVKSGVPLARPWTHEEWLIVCQHRAMLDALLIELSPRDIAVDRAEAIRNIGIKVPCYAMSLGCYLYLSTGDTGIIQEVPERAEDRSELARRLTLGFHRPIDPEQLPTEEGLFENIGGAWQSCPMFHNRAPSAIVATRLLLPDFPRWALCEAHERAHGIGLDDDECVKVEIALAKLFVESELPNAQQLLTESELRLGERSK